MAIPTAPPPPPTERVASHAFERFPTHPDDPADEDSESTPPAPAPTSPLIREHPLVYPPQPLPGDTDSDSSNWLATMLSEQESRHRRASGKLSKARTAVDAAGAALMRLRHEVKEEKKAYEEVLEKLEGVIGKREVGRVRGMVERGVRYGDMEYQEEEEEEEEGEGGEGSDTEYEEEAKEDEGEEDQEEEYEDQEEEEDGEREQYEEDLALAEDAREDDDEPYDLWADISSKVLPADEAEDEVEDAPAGFGAENAAEFLGDEDDERAADDEDESAAEGGSERGEDDNDELNSSPESSASRSRAFAESRLHLSSSPKVTTTNGLQADDADDEDDISSSSNDDGSPTHNLAIDAAAQDDADEVSQTGEATVSNEDREKSPATLSYTSRSDYGEGDDLAAKMKDAEDIAEFFGSPGSPLDEDVNDGGEGKDAPEATVQSGEVIDLRTPPASPHAHDRPARTASAPSSPSKKTKTPTREPLFLPTSSSPSEPTWSSPGSPSKKRKKNTATPSSPPMFIPRTDSPLYIPPARPASASSSPANKTKTPTREPLFLPTSSSPSEPTWSSPGSPSKKKKKNTATPSSPPMFIPRTDSPLYIPPARPASASSSPANKTKTPTREPLFLPTSSSPSEPTWSSPGSPSKKKKKNTAKPSSPPMFIPRTDSPLYIPPEKAALTASHRRPLTLPSSSSPSSSAPSELSPTTKSLRFRNVEEFAASVAPSVKITIEPIAETDMDMEAVEAEPDTDPAPAPTAESISQPRTPPLQTFFPNSNRADDDTPSPQRRLWDMPLRSDPPTPERPRYQPVMLMYPNPDSDGDDSDTRLSPSVEIISTNFKTPSPGTTKKRGNISHGYDSPEKYPVKRRKLNNGNGNAVPAAAAASSISATGTGTAPAAATTAQSISSAGVSMFAAVAPLITGPILSAIASSRRMITRSRAKKQ